MAARESRRWLWMTPLGCPDVPEVNSSCAGSSGFGARASMAARSTTALAQAWCHGAQRTGLPPVPGGISRGVPGRAVHHEDVFHHDAVQARVRSGGGGVQQPGHLRGVLAATEVVGHQQHPGTGALQRIGHLALAENRHNRADHRADAHGRCRDHHELAPVGQLDGDSVTGSHTKVQEQRGGMVHLAVQRRPAQVRCPVPARIHHCQGVRLLLGPAPDPISAGDQFRLVGGPHGTRRSHGHGGHRVGLAAPRPACGALFDLHVQAQGLHGIEEHRVGNAVRVGVGQRGPALCGGGSHRQGHQHPMVVEGGQVGAAQPRHAVHPQVAAVEVQVRAHAN